MKNHQVLVPIQKVSKTVKNNDYFVKYIFKIMNNHLSMKLVATNKIAQLSCPNSFVKIDKGNKLDNDKFLLYQLLKTIMRTKLITILIIFFFFKLFIFAYSLYFSRRYFSNFYNFYLFCSYCIYYSDFLFLEKNYWI